MGGLVEVGVGVGVGTGSVGRNGIAEEGAEIVGGTAWGRGWALWVGDWGSMVKRELAGLYDSQDTR